MQSAADVQSSIPYVAVQPGLTEDLYDATYPSPRKMEVRCIPGPQLSLESCALHVLGQEIHVVKTDLEAIRNVVNTSQKPGRASLLSSWLQSYKHRKE